jgi:hypothetical protein
VDSTSSSPAGYLPAGCAVGGVSVLAEWDWSELPALSLLVTALFEAEEARAVGRVVGPVVDEVAWRRAVRRARRADARRAVRRVVVGAGMPR